MGNEPICYFFAKYLRCAIDNNGRKGFIVTFVSANKSHSEI